ncbi:MAG: hypothetical protein HGA25_02785 [Clostridiales bacterium]|nr:hypothetical protein [Clostridiales bacterium]
MKKSLLSGIVLIALIIYPSKIFAADTATLQAQLTTYLPYILIGGAVILLISIVGILLSKKKEKTEDTFVPSATPAAENATPVAFTPEVQAPTQPVNMENISTNLYAPAETKPTIQETMESNTQTEELPMVQPEFTPSTVPATEQTQSSDLQDILQGEASASPMGPVTDHVMEATPVVAETTNTSFEAPLNSPISSFAPNPIPEVTTVPDTTMGTQFVPPVMEQVTPMSEPAFPSFNTSAPEVAPAMPDLQQFINNQVAEVPPMAAPIMETPAPVVTPIADFNPAPTDTTTPSQTGTTFSI